VDSIVSCGFFSIRFGRPGLFYFACPSFAFCSSESTEKASRIFPAIASV